MEFTLEPILLSKELILSRIDEERLWEHYGVKVTKGLFCSRIRKDSRPTVAFYKNNKGRLMYRDFGTGQTLDIFSYVQELFGCSYYMALQIIANDFGIIHRPDLKPNKAKLEYSGIKFEEKQSAIIRVQTREFNERELEWWRKYGVCQETLKKFQVYPVDAVWLNDNLFYQNVDNKYVFGYYGGIREGLERWRIYHPQNTKYKFISNWKGTMIQGSHMLPESGDYLVVTKALKDVMVLYEYGIPAIAPCSENLFITEAQYNRLKQRFKRIYCLYDLDPAGVAAEKRIKKQFSDVQMLLLPWGTSKDVSDYRKMYGARRTLELINKAKEYYGENAEYRETEEKS